MIENRAGRNYDADDVPDVVEADLVDFDIDTLREIVSVEEKEVVGLDCSDASRRRITRLYLVE